VSMYLSVRMEGKRKMIYVPRSMEERARAWVETYREVERQIELLSESCMERVLKEKKKIRADRTGGKRRPG